MTYRGEPDGNLTKEYPPEITAAWPGCDHLPCILGCDPAMGHCQRLAVFLRAYGETAGGEKP